MIAGKVFQAQDTVSQGTRERVLEAQHTRLHRTFPPTSSFASISLSEAFDNEISHFSLRRNLRFLCSNRMAAFRSRERIYFSLIFFLTISRSIESVEILMLQSHLAFSWNYGVVAHTCHLT